VTSATGRAHARRIHKNDALGDGFVGRAKAVGRIDDHNFAVQRLDAVAAKQFGSIVMAGRSAISTPAPISNTTVLPMQVSMPVL
jgi:hypothetical protein